ncbi:MAG TPA: hypothetical protein VLJ18_07055 [Thermoanaerobaculia bacterium]|nr:hypothetical protein [Thermoanaerobaculia bacterium]
MAEPAYSIPSPDLPALTVRWEGLVVAIDATTLNTIARKATRKVPEVREILIEPEDGRLGLTVHVKKGIGVVFRSHLESLRFKDGFLGFAIVDLRIFRKVPIPNWVITKIVERQPEGRAFFYPEERIVVVNLNGVMPPELSVQVKDVVCENGEMRFIFGPSQYRLDKVIGEMGRDPFSDE